MEDEPAREDERDPRVHAALRDGVPARSDAERSIKAAIDQGARIIAAHQMLVGPMDSERLRQAIKELAPAGSDASLGGQFATGNRKRDLCHRRLVRIACIRRAALRSSKVQPRCCYDLKELMAQ